MCLLTSSFSLAINLYPNRNSSCYTDKATLAPQPHLKKAQRQREGTEEWFILHYTTVWHRVFLACASSSTSKQSNLTALHASRTYLYCFYALYP